MNQRKWQNMTARNYGLLRANFIDSIKYRWWRVEKRGGDPPTFRTMARAFHLTYEQVEHLCDDSVELQVCPGIGTLTGSVELPKGEWIIEHEIMSDVS